MIFCFKWSFDETFTQTLFIWTEIVVELAPLKIDPQLFTLSFRTAILNLRTF